MTGLFKLATRDVPLAEDAALAQDAEATDAESAHLPARLPVGRLAADAVRFTAASVAGLSIPMPPLDPARIATAFRSERVFRIDGVAQQAWAPLSGFFRCADGWLRTHANYPHHAAALRAALGADDPEALAASLVHLSAQEAEDRVVAAGGVAAAVRTAGQWAAHPAAEALVGTPLLTVTPRGAGAPHPLAPDPGAPLAGVRVLDLTRVIAGPVAGRTLALLGAQVLRIDPPEPAEIPWQHLDTGAGKPSALLDLHREPERLRALLADADVLLHGYRPGALARAGLDSMLDARPDLVVASLSAWGTRGPWAERRGFDSIVQAASGIARIEGDDAAPGALPAQALDHSAGYLLAGAVVRLLRRRAAEGGGWSVSTSLARIAQVLLDGERTDAVPPPADATTTRVESAAGTLQLARPALLRDDWPSAPRPWGTDQPEWWQ